MEQMRWELAEIKMGRSNWKQIATTSNWMEHSKTESCHDWRDGGWLDWGWTGLEAHYCEWQTGLG